MLDKRLITLSILRRNTKKKKLKTKKRNSTDYSCENYTYINSQTCKHIPVLKVISKTTSFPFGLDKYETHMSVYFVYLHE